MKVSIHQALKRLPATATEKYPQGAPFVTMMAGGTGQIVINGQRSDCAAGDAFFVAAGVEHRFENFSDAFVTWVVFYGQQGGE